MIERRPGPCGRIVAVLAGGGKELLLRRMARIGSVVVIGLVAADTCSRQGRVIVVDVAIRALAGRHYVRSRQRECRSVVIERGIGPDRGAVTEFARSGEAGCSMGRIRGACVIFLVARIAESAVQRIVVVDVAIRALTRRRNVRPGERESGGSVVEFTVRPKHGVVATLTGSWEVGGDVVHR
jgi:hypothetical protein